MKYRWILPCLFLLQSFVLQAAPESRESRSEPVEARLISEEKTVQPGRPFWVGVELNMAEGWDTYWMNPGDVGFPTQINWSLPQGFKAGTIQWPYPEKFQNESLVGFGYTKSVLLLTEITPPKNLIADQPIELKADVNWLACKDSCVPGQANLSLQIPVTDQIPQLDSTATTLFSKAREQLPYKLSKDEGDVTVQAQKEEIVLNFKPNLSIFKEIEEVLFISAEQEMIDNGASQNMQKGTEGITLNIRLAHPEINHDSPVKGILLVSEKGNLTKRAIHIDTSIQPPTPTPSSPVNSEGISSVGIALSLAFVGGLILNVMPCVLPVIALKIFGFVKMAHQRRSVIFQHGAIFSLGVLVSFWVLSGALLILRAYGEGVGWGFQLQEPIFVVILASILFLLGLSLFGVFEMGTSLISLGQKSSNSTSPLSSSFMSGVLATLVATPCTGPLMGPALGFAMTLPTIQALLIFTSMGLGMAFPYLLFSAFPKLIRFLPKPGNWMITFKQLMGFIMMATVVWLIWVFGAQTDNMAIFFLLAGLLIMAVGAWIFGKWGAPTRRRVTRSIALIISAMIFFTGGGTAILMAKQHRDSSAQIEGKQLVADCGWEIYSPDRVAALQEQGIPVFIDFTAKWCLICQANKIAMYSADIQKAFQEKGVVPMIADWTKRDSVITKELERLGRTGVPVYVLYSGKAAETPYILPQNLNVKVIREYLDKIEAPKTTVYAN